MNDNSTPSATPSEGPSQRPTASPVPTPQQSPITPATPSTQPVSESAAPVSTPADPNAPVITASSEIDPNANPFDNPVNAPFEQPTAPVPADLVDTTPSSSISEATPSNQAVTGNAAPVSTPADPNIPTAVPAVADSNYHPVTKKNKTGLIVGVIAAIIIVIGAVLLAIFVF